MSKIVVLLAGLLAGEPDSPPLATAPLATLTKQQPAPQPAPRVEVAPARRPFEDGTTATPVQIAAVPFSPRPAAAAAFIPMRVSAGLSGNILMRCRT